MGASTTSRSSRARKVETMGQWVWSTPTPSFWSRAASSGEKGRPET